MTAHAPSDNVAIEQAADMRLANARRYFEQTARAIFAARDTTLEALWSEHDSSSRGLRTEGLADMRRKVDAVAPTPPGAGACDEPGTEL